jgi:hypothetical protein
MRLLISTLVLFLTAAASPQRAASAGDQVIGEWRGTSLCTNLKLAPACKDETVRYVFTRNDGATNTYHQVADKLVSGTYETMGEMDFVYSAADATWSSELNARNCAKCKWWFRVNPQSLAGGLTDQSGEPLRKVLARRYVP